MTINLSDMTIYGGGDAEAKKELALAIKANAEAAKALAARMATESTGVRIEGDTIHNHYATLAPDADEGEDWSMYDDSEGDEAEEGGEDD